MSSPNLSVASAFIQLVAAIKRLKEGFGIFSSEKNNPVKKLYNLLINWYRKAKKAGTTEAMQNFAENARLNVKNCASDFRRKIKANQYTHGISDKKIKLITDLSSALSVFEDSLSEAKATEDEINKARQDILNSPEYKEVDNAKGVEVYRVHISHAIGSGPFLEKVPLAYELTVVLNGRLLGEGKNIRFRKGCRTLKVADVSLQQKFLGYELNIGLFVYVTFTNRLMNAGGELLNISNNLPPGLLNG
jgi:hypothetical protein